MKKRILIITDSLGCPRNQIPPNQTWTEKIISKYGGEVLIYTYCIYGLRCTDIPFGWIQFLKPNIIICQFGICDACKRATPEKILNILQKFQKVGKVYQRFASKYHYYLTKFWNIHYTDLFTFEVLVKKLCVLRQSQIAFIPIAPPGDYLINKSYGILSDVKEYNSVFIKNARSNNITLLSVYDGVKSNDIILKEDGHHLNARGNELVYNAVVKYIDERI